MPYHRIVVCVVFLAAFSWAPGELTAQESPYVDLTDRAIKALSESDIEALQTGAGMGYALAAELNHYPGPKHVLELRDSLALSVEQANAIQDIYGEMLREAQELGRKVIGAEAHLDSLFYTADMSSEKLGAAVNNAGSLESQLRIVHLGAHLRVRPILTEHQRQTYDRLRGYGGGHAHVHGN